MLLVLIDPRELGLRPCGGLVPVLVPSPALCGLAELVLDFAEQAAPAGQAE